MRRDQLPQLCLCLSQPAAPHVDVGQTRHCVRRRIERQRLFEFAFGFAKFLLFFQQLPGRQVRFGIFRLQCRSLPVSRNGLLRLGRFKHMRQREPCPLLAFGDVACGLSSVAARRYCSASGCPVFASCSPRFRFDSNTSGFAATDLRYAAIESSHFAQAILHKPKFKPRHIIRRIVARSPSAAKAQPQRSHVCESDFRPE